MFLPLPGRVLWPALLKTQEEVGAEGGSAPPPQLGLVGACCSLSGHVYVAAVWRLGGISCLFRITIKTRCQIPPGEESPLLQALPF